MNGFLIFGYIIAHIEMAAQVKIAYADVWFTGITAIQEHEHERISFINVQLHQIFYFMSIKYLTVNMTTVDI